MSSFIVVMAQINPLVGDIPGNTKKVIESVRKAEQEHNADVVVFPELTLMAYPPEDLLLRDSVGLRIEAGLQSILKANLKATVVVGYPRLIDGRVYNAAGVIRDGELVAEAHKQCLPNYQVFDDKRYFTSGEDTCVVDIQGVPTALMICEDVWKTEPCRKAKEKGAKLALVLNASPFELNKVNVRPEVLSARNKESGLAFIYVNQLGGQDELVFDGGSMAMDSRGEIKSRAPLFEENLYPVEVTFSEGASSKEIGKNTAQLISMASSIQAPIPSKHERVYQALVMGVKDYINKNGFKGIVLGLSGGIDSALVLAIATDALGSDRVEAVMMPYRYTSDMSVEDAGEEARYLGVEYKVISIEPMVEAFLAALKDEFAGLGKDTTEENLQARCRGNILMAISNKKGSLVLTTGNKSEMAVGYATLYGDMAGGFDVLKDVSKTLVFELAEYRNTLGYVIPQRVIDRPPSAELAPDQKDEDSLPAYPILDQILAAYIEEDKSGEEIIASGFSREDVEHVLRLVDINEYKRRQAAVGPRITKRGFGRDRRYPITSGWKIGH
ncbi:MAG: NAD+ synthase [Cellvibrionaceae bacterium]